MPSAVRETPGVIKVQPRRTCAGILGPLSSLVLINFVYRRCGDCGEGNVLCLHNLPASYRLFVLLLSQHPDPESVSGQH